MKLILIRHGETAYTCKKRLCGAINTPLNEQGIKQAQQLARQLKRKKIDVVYASPMKRTVQTANIIFGSSPHQCIGVRGKRPIKIQKDTLLRETFLGKWEGLTIEEIEAQFPQDVKRWHEEPMTFGAPGGEDLETLQTRVRRFLNKLHRADKDGRTKTIAIVSHSGPIRIILGEISGHGLKGFWDAEPKTGEYQEIKYQLPKAKSQKRPGA